MSNGEATTQTVVTDAEGLERDVMAKYATAKTVTKDANAQDLTNDDPSKVSMLTELDSWDIDLSQYQEGYFSWLRRVGAYPHVGFMFGALKPQIEKLKVNKDRKGRIEYTGYLSAESGHFDPMNWLRMMMEEKGTKDK